MYGIRIYTVPPCLGKDVTRILNSVVSLLVEGGCWAAADIDTNNITAFKEQFSAYKLKAISSLSDLLKLVNEVDQFYSGIIVYIRNFLEFNGYEVATEDLAFRNIPFCDFEFRFFDTSFFEIYTPHRDIIDYLSQHYHVEKILV